MNLALSGLPEFRALPGSPGPQHRATMHICPSIEYVERAWDDAKYGYPSEQPLVELTIPTMYDPSLAPPGKHIMGVFLQYAPNFRSIILDREVLTPLDLERRERFCADRRLAIRHSPMSGQRSMGSVD